MIRNKRKRTNDVKKNEKRKKFVRRKRGKETRMELRSKEEE